MQGPDECQRKNAVAIIVATAINTCTSTKRDIIRKAAKEFRRRHSTAGIENVFLFIKGELEMLLMTDDSCPAPSYGRGGRKGRRGRKSKGKYSW
jgi:hypothetical protein